MTTIPLKHWLLGSLLLAGASPCLHAQSSSTTTLTLSECYASAEQNYKPLCLAKEEILSAEWKLAETTRNLYPTMNLKAERTDGEADRTFGTPNFREESYGVQMSYNLYEGGKSWATRKQAKANFCIAQLKYRKTRLEMAYGVLEAYWNLARVQANLEGYQQALADIRAFWEQSRGLYNDGVISEREFLAIESQYNQASYQVDAAKTDRESFAWKLADALGLQQAPAGLPAADIPHKELAIQLEECITLAFANNPEIVIQKLTAEAAAYGAAVKKGYKLPKLDFNGFYGRSGGAYENEEFKLGEDYQIGVQLSQFFLFNTLTGSGIKQHTSPKVGQSSRTAIATVSAGMNVLDGYKQVAEEKEARLAADQAAYGLEKTRNAVNREVRDAYFNYRKALTQVRNTQVDAAIAEKELAISRINMGNNQSTLAGSAEAVNKLAGAKAALNEAKAFYLLSLAALNKAVGVENRYIVDAK